MENNIDQNSAEARINEKWKKFSSFLIKKEWKKIADADLKALKEGAEYYSDYYYSDYYSEYEYEVILAD